MTLNVFFILVLCLTIVPCKKISLHYSLGPGTLTWTSTLKSLFTYHSNLSWTPPILYLTHAYHTQIPIKILDSFYLRIYAGINTTKPLLQSAGANTSHFSLLSFNFYNGQTVCITGPITITLLDSNMASSSDERYLEH